MVIPYRDENKTVHTPVVTLALIAVNVLVWLRVQGAGASYPLAASVCNYGLIPGELSLRAPPGSGTAMAQGMWCLVDPGRAPEHIITAMFLHGNWMHLLGNMWFLWLFGNNVEDVMGRLRFLTFYLLCGVAAALAQVWSGPDSLYPIVGASGAISGVMGGYLLLFPHVRVYTLVIIVSVALPAWVVLGYWIGLQILGGLAGGEGTGVAFWEHVGGFAVGAALVKRFVEPEYLAQHQVRQWRPQRVSWPRDHDRW